MTNHEPPTQVDPAVFAGRYVAAWNERDAGLRRDAVAALWTDDGEYCNRMKAYRGHDEVTTAVTVSHDRWVGAGYTFRPLDGAAAHHGTLTLRWEMVPASGGAAESAGLEFIVLDDDGRIQSDHQFIEL
jgi:hypothetical protein